ncbi:hypothetical protein ACM64Y_00730 [Novispirillum sp. DQ9]|uniref:hypothetical protein n=1 Tax=Novispirillum sp. DQ9 TaxID=3398612 RepID=UPI003C7CD032
MAQLIGYDVFRALKACRSIEQTNGVILDQLSAMRRDADGTCRSLEEAGRRLEESLGHFSAAQQRLSEVRDQHVRVMRVVDAIMATSPAFQGLRGG